MLRFMLETSPLQSAPTHKMIQSAFSRGVFGLLAWLAISPVLAEPLQFSKQLILAQPAKISTIESSPTLRPLKVGQRGKAVAALAEVIAATSATPFKPAKTDVFGPEFEAAIIELQNQIGIEADGIAGPLLYANLTTSATDKNAAVAQWALRLEKLAFEAREEGRTKMIVVNVPSYTLRAIDLTSGKTIVESPVVIGRADRKTPIGRLDVIGIKYNPPWVPPPVVMKSDILPKVGKNSDWFQKHRLQAASPEGETKPAAEVTAEDLEAGWRFFQPGNGHSALGQIKFETNSKENIYLHDTNERGLFASQLRARSSGCIRVQKWKELASFILDVPAETITKSTERGVTRLEKTQPIPVYVEYSLVDVRENKAIAYPNIYARSASY
jgi:L,D-transpeptidase YcbB